MKNLLILFLLITLCVMFAAVAAMAQSATNAKQELMTIYALQDKAIMARDAKTITAFYALTYVAKTKQGTIRRAESLQNLEDFFSTTSEISLAETTLEKIEQVEDAQIAFITRQIRGVMIFAGGKTREFEATLRAEEHWTKTSKGKWITHAGVERSQTLKIDGIDENTDVLESKRTEIEAIYDQIDVALKTKNIRAMFVHWAKDFIEVQNGKTSKSAEIEAAYAALFSRITEVSSVVNKINKIKTVDGNYIVEMSRTIEGEMISKNKRALFGYTYEAQELWTQEEQKTWKLKISEILSDKFLIDGKEVK